MTDIHDLTVTELAAAIGRKELSPVQITAHYLDRTDRLNADVGAFFTVTAELATEPGRRGREGGDPGAGSR